MVFCSFRVSFFFLSGYLFVLYRKKKIPGKLTVSSNGWISTMNPSYIKTGNCTVEETANYPLVFILSSFLLVIELSLTSAKYMGLQLEAKFSSFLCKYVWQCYWVLSNRLQMDHDIFNLLIVFLKMNLLSQNFLLTHPMGLKV